jgi:hypothetical protein
MAGEERAERIGDKSRLASLFSNLEILETDVARQHQQPLGGCRSWERGIAVGIAHVSGFGGEQPGNERPYAVQVDHGGAGGGDQVGDLLLRPAAWPRW